MAITTSTTDATTAEMPEPGRQKRNPAKVDQLLDDALESSMAASDPPAITQPDVRLRGVEVIGRRADELKASACSAVTNNPLPVLGIAFALGAVVGLLLPGRR